MPNRQSVYDWQWFVPGLRRFFSIPAMILMSAFVGYGGIARESGLGFGETVFSVGAIWAMPANLILVAGISSGAALPVVALAAGLSSVRLMPMVMALVPVLRVPGTRVWHLLLVCTFVAVTSWVHVMERAPKLAANARLPYFAGFVVALVIGASIVTSISYLIAGTLPAILIGALYFLTPNYFLSSLWNSSTHKAEKLALASGVFIGPACSYYLPSAGILLGGLSAGLIAFIIGRRLDSMGEDDG